MKSDYKGLFAGKIDISLKTATNMLSVYPASATAFSRLSKEMKQAQATREKNAKGGVEVPPLLIISTTDSCNLSCAGCYSCAHKREQADELPGERVFGIMDEAADLGVRIVLLAGGEPLLSRNWLDAMAAHSEMLGIVFTNGTLMSEARRAWFSENRHIIPAFSIEGGQTETDKRRGDGVHASVNAAMAALKNEGIPFGISLTVTSRNIDGILDAAFIEEYIAKGCRLFFYVEYVPAQKGTEPLVLSNADKKRLAAAARKNAKKHPAIFIPFPGDEEQFGGCLAAGRGFLHISANGDAEPCPFAPFSDTNLRSASLKEALQSKFLAAVRENHHLLKEGTGGCALWSNREWLEKLK